MRTNTLPSQTRPRDPPESGAQPRTERLRSLSDVPYLRMHPALLPAKAMPPETVLILRLIDGRRDVERILDSCPFEVPAVLETLSTLLREKIINIRR